MMNEKKETVQEGPSLFNSFFGGGFEIIFSLMFVLISGMFIVSIVRSVSQWHKNNNSPRLTVQATVTSKQTQTSHHHNSSTHTSSSHTYYYATFQVESGDRMELALDRYEYGQLAEGDTGRLTFQGTRYLSFERQ